MNKKGSVILVTAILLLGAIIMVILAANLSLRECNNNGDCSADSYCGSNYQCLPYPEEVVVRDNNYLLAAIVLGVSMIIAAYILRRGKKE